MKEKNFLSLIGKIFGIALICHVMCILTSFSILIGFNNMITRFFTLIINCVIYYSLIFAKVRQEGERDKNRVSTGHMQSTPYKGLAAALIASLPLILLSILLIIAKFGVIPGELSSWFRFINTPYVTFYAALMPSSQMFSEVSFTSVIISALTPLIMPAVAGFAYAIGYLTPIGSRKKAARA